MVWEEDSEPRGDRKKKDLGLEIEDEVVWGVGLKKFWVNRERTGLFTGTSSLKDVENRRGLRCGRRNQ